MVGGLIMIPSYDWSILLRCVHSKNWNSSLLCEFPDNCDTCMYHDVHGTHNVKKALKVFHQWEKECKLLEDAAIEIW